MNNERLNALSLTLERAATNDERRAIDDERESQAEKFLAVE
jgi:hypothetical protein